MTADEAPLAGAVALVVGFATPSGRAIATGLAAAGADVAVASATLDGDEIMAAKGAARAIERLGRRSFSQGWDVTLPTNVQVGLKQIERAFGHPKILVFNAHAELTGPMEKVTDSGFGRMQQVNLAGAFYAARSFVRELPGGAVDPAILYIVPGASGEPQAAYAAARGGEATLARVLAAELAPRGIRVNCLWSAPREWLGGMIDEPALHLPGVDGTDIAAVATAVVRPGAGITGRVLFVPAAAG